MGQAGIIDWESIVKEPDELYAAESDKETNCIASIPWRCCFVGASKVEYNFNDNGMLDISFG